MLFNTILGIPFELQVEYNGPQNPILTIKAPILESNLLGRTMPTSCSSRASAVSSGFQHRTGPTANYYRGFNSYQYCFGGSLLYI